MNLNEALNKSGLNGAFNIVCLGTGTTIAYASPAEAIKKEPAGCSYTLHRGTLRRQPASPTSKAIAIKSKKSKSSETDA